jgi:diguanylate cyclase (GGDEF)-like protein
MQFFRIFVRWSVSGFYCVLTFIGMLALLCALWPVTRIRKILPEPSLIRAWYVLSGFILFFITGYLSYLLISCTTHTPMGEAIVPIVFFSGGIFVFIVCRLFDITAQKLLEFRRLEYESIRDPLTGTFNRRHMKEMLKTQAAFARRNGTPLALVLIDLDYFKAVNDRYGHLCGDSILRQVTDTIGAQARRDMDMLFRYGGEEFLLMLPQTPLKDAVAIAEKIRTRIADTEFRTRCNDEYLEVKCTASIGVGVFDPEQEDITQCLERVDARLYQAKDNGRNQVVY